MFCLFVPFVVTRLSDLDPVPSLCIPSRFNLAAALLDRRISAGDGERPAFETAEGVWSYARIADLVDRAGTGLRSLGVAPEQRVVLVVPDGPEFVIAFLAALKIGAVAVPCSTFLDTSDYELMLRESRAAVAVTTRELCPRLDAASAPELRTILLTDAAADDGRHRAWAPWIDAASPIVAAADTHRDEPAFWLWTSGSTGHPKAAVHAHQDAPWCCHLYAEQVLGISPGDRIFSAAKLFHAYGLGNALLFPFWTGATSILHAGRATADAVYTALHRSRPTVFFGVPTLFARMLQVPEAERRFDLSSLRVCVSAGEPLPAELFLRWRSRFGTEILDGLGSTELLNTYLSARPGRVTPGSTGMPVPGYSVKIVTETGEAAAPNVAGELLVNGPSCALMYWNRRDQTRRCMRGEWFASGDRFLVDADGYYWYQGRGDDMFKVTGEWISPVEIERALSEHPAVVECAVVASSDAAGVMVSKAWVVLGDGRTPGSDAAAELQAFLRGRLAHYKCPREIAFLPDLPKTATGKVQRFKLR